MTAFWQLPLDAVFAASRGRLSIDDVDRTPGFDHGGRRCMDAATGFSDHPRVALAGG